MENKQLCVIIPVHKPDLSEDDIISLKACKTHLTGYDCFLVYPKGMNVEAYCNIHKKIILQPVTPAWLSSIENYNQMKVNAAFYKIFEAYHFMLTYELDAYIFNADFNKYDVFKYDYIGAPFFEGYLHPLQDAPFIKGGNSGFSVRNIQACISILQSLKKYSIHWLFYKKVLSRLPKKIYNAIVGRINRLTNNRYEELLNGRLSFFFMQKPIWEDIVWSVIVPSLFPNFRVADSLAALQFSFEICPERLLTFNNGCLPLGCHGWPKNKEFWKKYIQ